MEATSTPKKESLYQTAVMAQDLPGIKAGEYVKVVKYHESNDTYTIRSIGGVLQCMVSPSVLEKFCL